MATEEDQWQSRRINGKSSDEEEALAGQRACCSTHVQWFHFTAVASSAVSRACAGVQSTFRFDDYDATWTGAGLSDVEVSSSSSGERVAVSGKCTRHLQFRAALAIVTTQNI